MSDLVCSTIRNFVSSRSPRQIRDDEPLVQSGCFDSLGILELVTYIEREFAIQLADEDISPENFQSIQTVADLVTRRSRG